MDTILLFFPCINTFLRFGGLPWFLIGKESACSTGDVEDPLEKEIATYSSIVAWKILWTEKPGGLQSLGSQKVGHNSGLLQAKSRRRGSG